MNAVKEKILAMAKKILKVCLYFAAGCVAIKILGTVFAFLGPYIARFINYTNGLYFIKTNLFNFIIFASVIAFLVIKLDVKSKLETSKQAVNETINTSELVKEEAEKNLDSVEESFSHLEEKVDLIIKQSEENANLVGEKIMESAEAAVNSIQENTQKALENSRVLLKNDLIRRASLASIEVAKAHILEELKRNSELHDRLIDESINAIEGVEL